MRILTGTAIIILTTLIAGSSLAKLSDKQKEIIENQRKNFELQQQKMHSNMPGMRKVAGTYQAININDKMVFILDTTSGKFWVWEVKSNSILYQDQVQESQ